MNLEKIGLSHNDQISSLDLLPFRRLHSETTINVFGANQIPCDGHLCWYILYEWPFDIDADIVCNGSTIDINDITATYLRCSGM